MTRLQKLYLLAILVIIIIISHLPSLVGKLVFVDEGISRNDLMVFLLLPSLSLLLMLIFPFFAASVKPELAGFDRTWFRKTRSEIQWIFLLPLILLALTALTRYLIKQLGLPIVKPTLFFSTSAIFFCAYTFLVALVVPIVEEIFWRGFIQDCLGKIIRPRIALLIQAIAFAAMHLRQIGGFFEVFVLGLIFGLWRYKKRTLLPIIITHIITNSLFCAYLWYSRAELAKINIKVNYVAQFKEISRPANYDPNDNADSYYKKAFELSVKQPEQLSSSDIQSWPEDLPKEKQILLQNWVPANGEALEQLKLGSQKSYYWPKYEGNSIWDISLASLGKAKTLTLVLCTRAKLNTTRGNLRASILDLLVCYKFGTHFAGPKILVEQLVGIAFRANAVQAGFEILDKADPDPCLLEDFQQKLQVLSTDESYTLDFTGVKFGFYDVIQMAFTDDGKGDGRIPEGQVEHLIRSFAGMNYIPPEKYQKLISVFKSLERRGSVELADTLYEYFNEVRHKTPWQLHDEGKDIWEVVEQIAAENLFVLIYTPNVGMLLDVFCRVRVGTDALVTTLGLLRYKADKGEYPDTLQRLITAGYLRKLPMDPYSDKPLVYKRTKDNFILYSIGADFDDDGGVRSDWGKGKEGGDQVFWPVGERTTG